MICLEQQERERIERRREQHRHDRLLRWRKMLDRWCAALASVHQDALAGNHTGVYEPTGETMEVMGELAEALAAYKGKEGGDGVDPRP